jgi:hypothetical protein
VVAEYRRSTAKAAMATAALAAVMVAGGCGKTAGSGATATKGAHSRSGGKGHPGNATVRAANASPLHAGGPQLNVRMPPTTKPPVVKRRPVRRGRR